MLYHVIRFALMSALAVWCYQAGQRIRFGDWIWVTLRSLMDGYHLEATMPWRGGARFVGWALDFPLGWMLVSVGAILLIVQLWREASTHRCDDAEADRDRTSQGISLY
jgi:hypothetical protein